MHTYHDEDIRIMNNQVKMILPKENNEALISDPKRNEHLKIV